MVYDKIVKMIDMLFSALPDERLQAILKNGAGAGAFQKYASGEDPGRFLSEPHGGKYGRQDKRTRGCAHRPPFVEVFPAGNRRYDDHFNV